MIMLVSMIMCRDGRLIQFAKFLFVELLFINVFVVLCLSVCTCVRVCSLQWTAFAHHGVSCRELD